MTTNLDVSQLPFDTKISFTETDYNMRKYITAWRPILSAMMDNGVLKQNKSFGFAMMPPMWHDERNEREPWTYKWDNPYEYTWFVGGWGPDRDRYIANAVRKIRPLLRLDMYDSTLEMVDLAQPEQMFQDVVGQTDDNGNFPLGDFPHGGAVEIRRKSLTLVVACSAYTAEQDDLVSNMVGRDLVGRILADAAVSVPA